MMKIILLCIIMMNSIVINLKAVGQFRQVDSGTDNNLSSAYFIDENNGYITGEKGTLLKTSNGGESWIKTAPFTLNDLTGVWFTDPDNGIVIGSENTIFFTTNGGNSWNPLSFDFKADFTSIFFTSARTGYVAGKTDRGSIILRTSDGGKSWKTISLNQSVFSGSDREKIRGDIFINSLSFLNDTTGLLGGYTLSSQMEKRPFVCKTTDAATTFSLLNLNQEHGYSHEIITVDYRSENDAYALRSRSVDRSSLYAANYWIEECYPVSRTDIMAADEKYFGSFFIDRFIGYVSARIDGQTQVLKTIDHGETFIKLNPPTQETIMGITFINPQKGVFVGGRGLILIYNDGNNPPEKLENPFQEPAFSVAVPDLGDALTDLYVYNLNVSNEEDISVYFFNTDGMQVKILKSKTKLFNHEVRMKLKFEEQLTGMYYYVIKINEDPVVNGKLSASL